MKIGVDSVVTPSSPNYDDARRVWNERFDCRPRAILYPRDAREVASALAYVRDSSIPFRIRSGGHNSEGFSVVDNGIVIDMSRLSSVTVSDDASRAVVGPGALLGDVYQTLWAAGVTIPAGVCPDIRIGGHVLGGGIGMLVRSRGLLIDSLLGLDMVDAAGRWLNIDEDSHPDLLWASRGGGGGNFGIVTSYTLRTRPIGQVTLAKASWNWSIGIQVLDAWQRWVTTVDERVNSRFILFPATTGTVTMVALFEGPSADWEAVAGPLLDSYLPVDYAVRTVPFIDSVGTFTEPVAAIRAKFVPALAAEPLGPAALSTLERWHKDAPVGVKTGIYALGGAVSRYAVPAAFEHRDALFCVEFLGHWTDPARDREHLGWLAGIREEMREFMTGGAYINSPDRDLTDWPRAYYGNKLPRLMDVKRRYDPDNVFAFEQSIPVSMSTAEACAAGLTDEVIASLRQRGLMTP